MSDIIREVDEELRRERIEKLWQRYGGYIVGAAILLVLVVAGWRGWDWYAAREAAKAGARFEAALQLVNEGKRFEAEAAFNAIAKEGTAGYRLLARFRAAAETAKTDPAAGVIAYDALAADSSVDPALRELAKLHTGLILVDTAPASEIAARLEPLTAPQAPFRHSAREVLGLAHYRAGDRAKAQKIFTEIAADPETPAAMRKRAEIMRTLVSSVGGAPAASAPATQ
jgi:hypothetical protein